MARPLFARRGMQSLVKRASEHRVYLLPKAPGMFSTGVRLESFPRLPDRHDREVIQAPVLNQKLEAHHSRVLLAVGGKFPESFVASATIAGVPAISTCVTT